MTRYTDRLDQLIAGAVAPPPVVETLRLGTLDDYGEGWVKKTWTPEPELLNGDGSMFGGYIAALADQVLALVTMTVMPDGAAFRTINLGVQFYKVTRGEVLAIEAKVVSTGRTLVAVEAEFRRASNGDLIAKATAQQAIDAA